MVFETLILLSTVGGLAAIAHKMSYQGVRVLLGLSTAVFVVLAISLVMISL